MLTTHQAPFHLFFHGSFLSDSLPWWDCVFPHVAQQCSQSHAPAAPHRSLQRTKSVLLLPNLVGLRDCFVEQNVAEGGTATSEAKLQTAVWLLLGSLSLAHCLSVSLAYCLSLLFLGMLALGTQPPCGDAAWEPTHRPSDPQLGSWPASDALRAGKPSQATG